MPLHFEINNLHVPDDERLSRVLVVRAGNNSVIGQLWHSVATVASGAIRSMPSCRVTARTTSSSSWSGPAARPRS